MRGSNGIICSTLSNDDFKWIEKINNINKNTNKNGGSYLIKYLDGTEERRSSMSDFVAEFDQGGFIPDNRYCSSGKDAIFIRADDNIYRGCCTYLKDDIIGNIWDDNFKIPKENILCKLNENNANKDFRCLPCYHLNISEKVDD